jgi:hypothetical protein
VATADDIAAFRLLINEHKDEEPYTDASLGVRIDSATSREGLAAGIWREKAAKYSQLVTVAESGSSRQLSDMHKNALAMADMFAKADVTAPGGAAVRGVRMQRLTR